MQMLKKLLNSDKKYYLELDDIKDSEVVQTAVKTAEKAAETVKDKAAEVANSQPVQGAVQTATEAAEVAQDKLGSVVKTDKQPGDTKAKSEDKSSKTKSEVAKAKSEANSKTKANSKAGKKTAEQSTKKQAQSRAKNSGASSDEQPFWVAAMYNNSGSTANGNSQAAEQTFAPDNLMPTVSKYRRRPGGSMAKFRDMAKQAKTPKGR